MFLQIAVGRRLVLRDRWERSCRCLDVSPSTRSRVQEVPAGSQRNSRVATAAQTTSMTPSTTTGTQSEPQGSPFHSPRSSVTNWVRGEKSETVSYTHLRAHETVLDLVCRL